MTAFRFRLSIKQSCIRASPQNYRIHPKRARHGTLKADVRQTLWKFDPASSILSSQSIIVDHHKK